MTTLSIAHSRTYAVSANRSAVGRIPLFVWNSILVGLVAVLSVWYFVEVNLTMSRGYEIRDIQTKVGELQTQARSNQIKLSELQTVGNLSAQAASLGMVPVGQAEYVTAPTTGVAFR